MRMLTVETYNGDTYSSFDEAREDGGLYTTTIPAVAVLKPYLHQIIGNIIYVVVCAMEGESDPHEDIPYRIKEDSDA